MIIGLFATGLGFKLCEMKTNKKVQITSPYLQTLRRASGVFLFLKII